MGGRGEWRGDRGRPDDRGRPLPRGGPPPGYRQPPGRRPPPPPLGRQSERPRYRQGEDFHRDGGFYDDDAYAGRPPRREPDRRGYDDRRGYGDRRDDRLPPSRPPVRGRRRPRWRRIFGIFALVVLLLLVGTWFYIDFSLNRIQAINEDYSGRPAAGEGTNWLIVGTDSRAGLTAKQAAKLHTGTEKQASGKRTDTMMLLHIPDNSEKPTLISLLRDSYLKIGGGDECSEGGESGCAKLNAAYNDGSAQELTKTVELNTGLRIDHYAEIGFGGFSGVVDDVGGVDICVKQDMQDSLAGINLKAGCQTLDGKNALGYVRSRHATARSDYDRVDHQRQFLSALMGKVASPSTLLNPFRLVPLLADGPGLLTVNDGDHLQNLIGLALAMKGAGSGEVVTTTVPYAGGGSVSGQGSVIYWDHPAAQQMFHALNNDQPVPKSLLAD